MSENKLKGIEAIASMLGAQFLKESLDRGNIVEIPSLSSVMYKNSDGEVVVKSLEKPDDISLQDWNKMDFKRRRSEILLRKITPLIGRVPVSEIESIIQSEIGDLPLDFRVPSEI